MGERSDESQANEGAEEQVVHGDVEPGGVRDDEDGGEGEAAQPVGSSPGTNPRILRLGPQVTRSRVCEACGRGKRPKRKHGKANKERFRRNELLDPKWNRVSKRRVYSYGVSYTRNKVQIRPCIYVNPDELEFIERVAGLFALTSGGELRIGVAASILLRLGIDHLLSEPEFEVGPRFWEKHALDNGLAVKDFNGVHRERQQADPERTTRTTRTSKELGEAGS